MISIRADLHDHFTHRSKVLDPNQIADIVRTRLGPGGICALVNYDDERYEAFARKAEPLATNLGNAIYFPDREVLIVKGEEVPTPDDLLVLGLQEGTHLSQRKGMEYTMKEARDINGINVITTPFFMSKVGRTIEQNPNLLLNADAIEIHDGEATKRANRRALELHNKFCYDSGRDHCVGALANSDGHSFYEACLSYTKFIAPSELEFTSSEQVIENLRNLIKYAPRIFKRKYSLRGRFEHAGVIGGILLASRCGIKISRGDEEARR